MTLVSLSEKLTSGQLNRPLSAPKRRSKKSSHTVHFADGSVLWTSPILAAGMKRGAVFIHPALLADACAGEA